jgi:hypothetical protein
MSPEKKPLHHHVIDYFFPHSRNGYRPHIFSRLSVLLIVVLILVCEVGYVAETKLVFFNTNFLAAVLPGVLTDLTNGDRVNSGLTPVTRNPLLDTAAQAVAADMAAKGYFAHVAPDGTTPWHWLDLVGYHYSYAGQNLAVNFSDSEEVENAWLASPTHRENILKPAYTEVGFGTATGTYQGVPTTFVVEYFATPAAAVVSKPAPTKSVAVASPATVTSSSSATVLGTETKKPAVAVATSGEPQTPAQVASQPTELPSQAKQFVSVLSSPLSTLETILTVLLTIIAAAYGVALFTKGKFQHRSVVFGGAFLILLISGALLTSAYLTTPVGFAPDTQMASVNAALP